MPFYVKELFTFSKTEFPAGPSLHIGQNFFVRHHDHHATVGVLADIERVTVKTDTVLQERRLQLEIHADGIRTGIVFFRIFAKKQYNFFLFIWIENSGINQRPVSLRECPMILVKVSSGGTGIVAGIRNIIGRPQQRIKRHIYTVPAFVFEGGGNFQCKETL